MEGSVLFNDALNTFYLRLYGVRHMVKNHSNSEITYHDLCYTSRGTLAGTRNSSMGQPWRIDPTTHPTMSGGSSMELHLANQIQFSKVVAEHEMLLLLTYDLYRVSCVFYLIEFLLLLESISAMFMLYSTVFVSNGLCELN